jgi:hypothetical protein
MPLPASAQIGKDQTVAPIQAATTTPVVHRRPR